MTYLIFSVHIKLHLRFAAATVFLSQSVTELTILSGIGFGTVIHWFHKCKYTAIVMCYCLFGFHSFVDTNLDDTHLFTSFSTRRHKFAIKTRRNVKQHCESTDCVLVVS